MLLIAVRDLLFGSKLDAAARRTGATVAWAPRGVRLRDAVVDHRADALLVDLGEPGALDEVRAVRAERPDVRIVAFTGHLRTDLLDAARSLGIVEVLTRGQLSASVDDVLKRFAVPGGGGEEARGR